MRAITYLNISLLVVLFSCSKFEHEELDVVVTCELCDWADAREGFYAGVMTHDLQTNSQDTTYTDSLYIQVEHVFLNNNAYQDSTVMYFKLYAYHDSISNPSPNTSIVIASDSVGHFFGSHYYTDFYEDSISLIYSVGQSWPQWAIYSEIGVLHR